mmetsp:Transcript_61228/g.200156  ORF Transcript_61228/g.200156 Transcript_61228/m.200156 type:complete len:333 (-) Transcript_61228:2-1000(-)
MLSRATQGDHAIRQHRDGAQRGSGTAALARLPEEQAALDGADGSVLLVDPDALQLVPNPRRPVAPDDPCGRAQGACRGVGHRSDLHGELALGHYAELRVLVAREQGLVPAHVDAVDDPHRSVAATVGHVDPHALQKLQVHAGRVPGFRPQLRCGTLVHIGRIRGVGPFCRACTVLRVKLLHELGHGLRAAPPRLRPRRHTTPRGGCRQVPLAELLALLDAPIVGQHVDEGREVQGRRPPGTVRHGLLRHSHAWGVQCSVAKPVRIRRATSATAGAARQLRQGALEPATQGRAHGAAEAPSDAAHARSHAPTTRATGAARRIWRAVRGAAVAA